MCQFTPLEKVKPKEIFAEKECRILQALLANITATDKNKNEINNAIFSFNIIKSVGHDQIPPYFLRIASSIITPFLLIFAQYCFMNGIFPENCTIAKIISIFKKGDTQNPINYRPTSILICFSKISERLILTRLIKLWTKHNVLILI